VLLGIAYRGLGTQEMLAEAIAELRQAIDLDPTLMPARFYWLTSISISDDRHELRKN
jgi:hypothetical protein